MTDEQACPTQAKKLKDEPTTTRKKENFLLLSHYLLPMHLAYGRANTRECSTLTQSRIR